MIKSQLLKGLLEGCILKLISEKETYGYALTEELKSIGFRDVNEGTVYPLLLRLEKKMLIIGESRKSDLGPKRKYFTLSDDGKMYLQDFQLIWSEISDLVDAVMDRG